MTQRPKATKKKIGKYIIERQIGKGSAANIYLAKQDSLGRKLVIKELLPHYATNDRIITRFKREAKLISQLSHDVIVHIYDYWVHNNSYYFTMEYIPGDHLRKILTKAHYLPVHIAAIVLYQICRGLEHAHQNGVIHRDLKPANIMISDLVQIKILDFGVAHFQTEENLTALGAVLGTYNYMSPEQALGTKVTPASDIFSLGILFYELLTGTKPFYKDEKEDVLEKIVRRKPKSARKLNPAVPRSFERILKKCLRKKSKRRYQDVRKIKIPLEKFLKRYSLDHHAILKNHIENMQPMKIDEKWPPNFRQRVWYHTTHLKPRTYAILTLLLAAIIYGECKLIQSGINTRVQWEAVHSQSNNLWHHVFPTIKNAQIQQSVIIDSLRIQTASQTDSLQSGKANQ